MRSAGKLFPSILRRSAPENDRHSPTRTPERQSHNRRNDNSQGNSRKDRNPEHHKPDRKNGAEPEADKKRTKPAKGQPRQAATRTAETTGQRSLTRQPETPATADTKDAQPKHGEALQHERPGTQETDTAPSAGRPKDQQRLTGSQGRRVHAAPRLALYCRASEARSLCYTWETRAA